MLNAMWIYKVVIGVIDCPFVLSRLNFIVPRRILRNNVFIQTFIDHRNYIINQPLNNAIRDFNLVFAVIDFNCSIDKNKYNIINFLRNLRVTVTT